MNGFLLIDKEGGKNNSRTSSSSGGKNNSRTSGSSAGLNSFKLVIALRKIANQKRVGYAGTLDPLASGLMVMALGEYTKLLPYLESRDKVYEVEILLGSSSDTYDTDGVVVQREVKKIPSRIRLEEILKTSFTGKLEQRPPRFSAIQIGGKRAYDLARQGEDFQLKRRPVEIFNIEILHYDFPVLRLRVHCSSGTYIRSLAHDLGEALGCGGVVSALRRTAVGQLQVEKAVALSAINAQNLESSFIDPREIFVDKKCIQLSDEEYAVLARGNFIDNIVFPHNKPREKLPERLSEDESAVAFRQGSVVGIVETTQAGSKLKFRRKLHIF